MTQKVLVYDTTLRDGMQGEGMSLSAGEKLRVAHALDALGVHLIEAGFPASNPKEEELFELLSRERFETAEVAAFGMTRRREVAAADDPGLRLLADSLRPRVHARGEDLVAAPREGHEGRSGGEPADDRRLGGLPRGRGQAGGVRRRALLRRPPRRRRLRAALPPGGRRGGSRERDALRHERLVAPGQVAEATARVVAELDGVQVGIHTHDDAGCGVANALVGGRERRAPGAGHDERLRGALRQRQPRLDPAGAGAEARLRVDRARSGCAA